MSEPAAIGAEVREANAGEVAEVAAAIESLLGELGGRRPARSEMEDEVRAIILDPSAGTMLIARAGEELVGVLGASWCRAVHVPGRYAVVQDLWVDPEWRSRGVGAELVEGLRRLAAERSVKRLEVGLPRESFMAIESTERFYLANGFEHLGPRMRRILDE
jgi:GNAT superfamily N-acetyltransferase